MIVWTGTTINVDVSFSKFVHETFLKMCAQKCMIMYGKLNRVPRKSCKTDPQFMSQTHTVQPEFNVLWIGNT